MPEKASIFFLEAITKPVFVSSIGDAKLKMIRIDSVLIAFVYLGNG